jgi:hypothetical protein
VKQVREATLQSEAPEAPHAVPEEAPTEPLDDLRDTVLDDLRIAPRARRLDLKTARFALTPTANEGPESARTKKSRHHGTGPGRGGGPGGAGRGAGGLVQGDFAFGGQEGAFRGEVCFIEPGTVYLSEIGDCPRVALFFTDHFNVPPRHFSEGFPGLSGRTEWFSIHYSGEFSTRHEGTYVFSLTSDDGAQLFIDGQLVVNNDGAHEPRTLSGPITLRAGTHALRLLYYQGPRHNLALQLHVTVPYGRKRLFGPAL